MKITIVPLDNCARVREHQSWAERGETMTGSALRIEPGKVLLDGKWVLRQLESTLYGHTWEGRDDARFTGFEIEVDDA